MVKIIDTSYHKQYIDWDKVKESGVEGVILKATDGFFMPDDMQGSTWTGHVDPSFTLYWQLVKELFSWRGAYHFLRVDDELALLAKRPTSLEQIDLFYDTVTNLGFEWNDYAIIDIEQTGIESLTARQVAERVYLALKRAESLFGRKPIVYTGAWWWERYEAGFTEEELEYINTLPFWVSHYWGIDENNEIIKRSLYYIKEGRLFPVDWLDDLNDRIAYCRLPLGGTINPDLCVMWQYSSSGKIPGIDKFVDINMEIRPEAEWAIARGVEPSEPPIGENMYIEEILLQLLAEQQRTNELLENLEITVNLEVESPPENPEEPSDPGTLGVRVYNDIGKVYMFCVNTYNAKDVDDEGNKPPTQRGFPLFEIYPKNSSGVSERIYVDSGSVVQVFPEVVVGDGGTRAYVVDKAQLKPKAGSAPIPTTDAEGKDIKLFVLEKFIS